MRWWELSIAAASGVVVLAAMIKVVIPFFKSLHDAFRELVVALHIFNGRPPFVDDVTGERVPAVPPLGVALSEIRKVQDEQGLALSDLTSIVEQVADQQVQLTNLDTRLTALEVGTIERIVTKAESAAAWHAVGQANQLNSEPDQPGDSP